MTDSGRRRRGVAMVTVLVGLVALLGVAALTIDLGRTAVAAQRAQEVADAAALAAAAQLPDTDLADSRLADAVSANNQTRAWPDVAVNPESDALYYAPGESVPGCGDLEANQYAAVVTSHVSEELGFSRVAGLDTMNIARTATARMTIGHPLHPVIFARQELDWEDGFLSNGSGVYLDGAIHSNSGVVFHGSHITVTGVVEYRNYLVICGSDIDLQQGSRWGPILPYPVSYTWDQFLPWDYEVDSLTINDPSMQFGRLHVNGNLTIQSKDFQGSNGLVLVEGNVTFNGSGAMLQNMTIIAKGTIKFNGSCASITPYCENLALMSLAAGSKAIVFDGAGPETGGVLYAPNGEILFHGADHSTHNGSLIALYVTMKGGQYRVAGSENTSAFVKRVQLVK